MPGYALRASCRALKRSNALVRPPGQRDSSSSSSPSESGMSKTEMDLLNAGQSYLFIASIFVWKLMGGMKTTA